MLGVLVVLVLVACSCMTVFAAGDVSSAIQSTWNDAKTQIQNVVNNVVFPVLDMILAILFFVKIGSAYFDYRKHGQFEFTAPAILFACLIFTITAPLNRLKIYQSAITLIVRVCIYVSVIICLFNLYYV